MFLFMNVVCLFLFLFTYIFNFLRFIYIYKKNLYVKKAVNIFYVAAFFSALINNCLFVCLFGFFVRVKTTILF